MFVSHHTLKWTRTCRSHGRHPHAHTAHFLLNRHTGAARRRNGRASGGRSAAWRPTAMHRGSSADGRWGTVWARSWCRPPSAGCGSMCPTSAWRNSPGRNAGYDETDPRQGQCNRSRGSLHLHSQLSYTGLATFGRLRSKPLINMASHRWNKAILEARSSHCRTAYIIG